MAKLESRDAEPSTYMAEKMPKLNPPATSVPKLTLIPLSSISATFEVPLRRLKLELEGGVSSARRGSALDSTRLTWGNARRPSCAV